MTTKQLLAALALALCGPAFAAGNHAHEHQPLHGGIVTEVADIDYELVAQPDTLTLHLRDHGKPLALNGASAAPAASASRVLRKRGERLRGMTAP